MVIRFLGALIAALAMSGVALTSQAPTIAEATAGEQKPTEPLSPQTPAAAKNLIQDVETIGCIRLWKPAPDDPRQMPADRRPGLAGVYLLTPIASSPATAADLPTFLLTPSATLNFWQHVGHKVQVTGAAQPAPLPPTVQEIVTAPTQRPENKPSTDGMPRLTVVTLKRVAEGCT